MPLTLERMEVKSMEPILRIESLDTVFSGNGEDIYAVKNLSLQINPAQTLALVGESGSGKSVTAHSILSLLPGSATHPNGAIYYGDKNLLDIAPKALQKLRGNDICMIFQEPMTALNPLHKIGKQIAECLDVNDFPSAKSRHQRALVLLEQVKIRDAAQRINSYPHELSGGQRQRVMIAMAIANKPKLLIADEPTTALDVTVQQEILALLQQLQRDNGMAILMISHDLHIVQKYAHHVAVMKDGEIVEQQTCEQLFASPQHAYTQALLQKSGKKRLPLPDEASVLIEAEGLSVAYPCAKTQFKHLFTPPMNEVLSNIGFTLRRGESLGIVGESGSGKSTLANALLKLTASTGRIIFDGIEVSTLNEKQFRPYRQRLQVVFQDPFASLNPRMSIEDIISEGFDVIHNLSLDEQQQRIHEVLARVSMPISCLNRFAHEFSGGQRQRIAIARALVMRPDCIILDEPTSALDRTIQFQVLDLLSELQQQLQLSYIFISHDLALVKSFCHNVLVLQDGCQVEYGKCDTLFLQPKSAYTSRLIDAAFT